jgi:high-affinity iron transporter
MIGAFYTLSQDYFASTEDIWEGVFSILASVIISVMGAALLRVNKMQEKWRVKLMVALEGEERKKKEGKGKGTGVMRRVRQWSERHVSE